MPAPPSGRCAAVIGLLIMMPRGRVVICLFIMMPPPPSLGGGGAVMGLPRMMSVLMAFALITELTFHTMSTCIVTPLPYFFKVNINSQETAYCWSVSLINN